MKTRSNTTQDPRFVLEPRPRRSRSVVVSTAAAVALLAAALAGIFANPFADAQPVGNPGAINLKIVGGNIALGTQAFDLEPTTTTECNDGENNDGSDPVPGDNTQDLNIDFPADAQCTSLLDNSEVQTGFQPKQDTTITGTISTSGVVNVPTSGIFFPPIYQWQAGAVLTVQIVPTAAGTGNLNPLTGVASLSISIRISLSGSPSGVSLGSNCRVGPFTMALITGTTNPPLPNLPITGALYSPITGQATGVNNSFSVPGAEGCGPLGFANGQLNAGLGVPAAAGTNTAVLVLEANPKITKGVNASNVPSVTTGTAPLTVNFNGTGSTAVKPITAYAWNFGNSQTATGSTAFTTYSTPGTYTASLQVTDSDGDKDTQTVTITVNAPVNIAPTAAISTSGTAGIAPFAVSLSGSGSSDPDGSIAGYSWNFGDASPPSTAVSPSKTYNTPGTYTVTLTVTDNQGATGTATQVITVSATPNISPTASIQTVAVAGTIPLTVTFSGAGSSDPDGTIASYSWNFGNSTTATGPSAQGIFATAGTYTVTLTVTDNQGATGTQQVQIEASLDPNIAPSAAFTTSAISGSAPLSVNFDGTSSSDVDGTIATYAWNFGNGQNAAGATASATYTLPGTYTAALTVTDNKGAVGTATRTIVVSRPPNVSPVADFTTTPASGTAPLLVQLSSSASSDPDGAIVGYAWNFGNSTTSTAPSPSAIYSTAGSFVVTLTITDNDGATAVKSSTVVVSAPNVAPVAVMSATPVTGSAPLLVNVNGASSSDPDGSVVGYAWNFGNGQTATGATSSVTYATTGSFLIRLTVTDNRGATRSTTTTVVVSGSNLRPIAVVSALPTSGPAPLLTSLSAVGSTDPDGSIVSYAWNFGNGQSATGLVTQVSYTTPGTYTATLTVTDNRGATATATETIVVDPPLPVRDRVRLQLTGSVNYGYDGPISSGNFGIASDQFGVVAVSGSGTFGPTGSVSVSLNRFLWFNAFVGTVNVSDTVTSVNTSTSVFFQPLSRPSATSVRGSAGGVNNLFQAYNLAFTIDDRA